MGSLFSWMANKVACLYSWFEASFTKRRVGTQSGKGRQWGHLQTGVVKHPDPDLDKEVWEQTLEELSNIWTCLDEEYEPSKHLIDEWFGLW